MQRLFRAVVPVVLAAFLTALTGCTGLVQDDLDATHQKLDALKELVSSVNNQLTILNKIVGELDDSHTIIPGSFKETDEGYEVSFKDGKTIVIPYGKDGVDGETFIPVGVLSKDGYYYWTVNGEPILGDDGKPIKAGSTDGVAPEITVEGDYWYITWNYPDGTTVKRRLASCEDVDGIRVFSGYDRSDPNKLVLTLLDGTVIELPYFIEFNLSFDGAVMDTIKVSAGELIPIPYKVLVEGGTDQPVVVTSGTDGVYFSQVVRGEESGAGVVKVQVPDPFEEGYILLNAYCGGNSTTRMISFQERHIPFAEQTVRLASGEDTRTVAYDANFDYEISVEYPDSEADADWLEVKSESGSISFKTKSNPSEAVRTCTVKITPKDNPDYLCTTFDVKQATDNLTYELEPADGFSLTYPEGPEGPNLNKPVLNAPVAGGDVVVWLSSILKVESNGNPDWAKPVITEEDGFYKISISVGANESGASREGVVKLRLIYIQNTEVHFDDVASITINQAGK